LTSAIASSNGRVWRTRNFVRAYTGRALRPAEVMVLVRHRELFSGRVLELGAGAGRVSGYLIDLASSYHGIDLSPRMVEHGRARYPDGTFEVRDLLDLVTFADGSFDLVFAGYNVLDVLDDVERRRVLRDIYRILARDGALVMSSHNRASSAASSSPARVELTANPLRLAYRVVGAAASVRNRRRLAGFEREEPSHAIRNDAAHWYRLLHYYIGRDEQETQLEEAGFKLLECLDEDGKSVRAGEPAAASSELHYVAQRLPIP
jgi:SAM-dependent methyltransferase